MLSKCYHRQPHHISSSSSVKSLKSFINIKVLYVTVVVVDGVYWLFALSAFRPGRRASSVRSVTWRSATNQRSALTTIPSTVSLHVNEGRSAAQEITNAVFAARNTVQNKCCGFTKQICMDLGKFNVSHAIFAHERSTRKAHWKRIYPLFTGRAM